MKKVRKYPVKDSKLCNHGNGEKSCFEQLSENAEGCALMKCRKCGLEKTVTVREIVGNDVYRNGRKVGGV